MKEHVMTGRMVMARTWLAAVAMAATLGGCAGCGGTENVPGEEVDAGNNTTDGGASSSSSSGGTSSTSSSSSSGAGSSTMVASSGMGGASSMEAASSGVSGSGGVSSSMSSGGIPLVSVDVTPFGPRLAVGTFEQLVATALYADGSTVDVTATATWTSTDPAVATVSATGRVDALTAGMTSVVAELGGLSGSVTVTVTSTTLERLEVTPAMATLPAGVVQAFTATGVFSDGTTQDLTEQAEWTTSNMAVLDVSTSVGTRGQATGISAGDATLTATALGVSGTAAVTVTSATLVSIAVTPTAPILAAGTSTPLGATGTFSDGSTLDLTALVTWTSSDEAVATVSNAAGSQGRLTGVAPGMATITATLDGISGTMVATTTSATLVSVGVTPSAPTLAAGTTLDLVATGVFSDGTSQDLTALAGWSTSDPAVAVVSNAPGTQGRVTGQLMGTATITATVAGVSGSVTLTVTAATLQAITVTPAILSLAAGTTANLVATGTYSDATTADVSAQVTWSSTDDLVATVSNAAGTQGQVSAVAQGMVDVRATLGGVSGSSQLTVTAATLVSIAVTPTNPTLAAGLGADMAATGTYSDGSTQDLTTQVTWTSSDGAVATVSNAAGTQGRASAVAAGMATITATLGAVSGSTTLTVNAATVVLVDVTPPVATLAAGNTLALQATATLSDGTTRDVTTTATWTSSDNIVATVSNAGGTQGTATALAVGNATLTASVSGVSGTMSLSVTAATLAQVAVSPVLPTVAAGNTLQFTATGIYSDGTNADVTGQVTWSSGTTTVAAISNAAGSRGLATGLAAGTAVISAALDGVTGSTTLTVTGAALVSISVSPTAPTINAAATQPFTATGVYSDGTSLDVTTQVTWTSSMTTVATISNAAGSQGLATATGPGTTTVTASSAAITGSTTLTVNPAVLVSIALTPVNPSAVLGTTLAFTATGTFDDGSTQDVTEQVTWSSSVPAVATVSNVAGSKGRATALATGATDIRAALGIITSATRLTVSGATLLAIEVTPNPASMVAGARQQFTARGSYSDGTTLDVTAVATWTSSATAVATVSNVLGSRGLVTALAPGMASISATLSGITGAAALTVSDATLASMAITPASPSLAAGTTTQLVATGTYSDGSMVVLTANATWSSSNAAVAAVGNALNNKGRLAAVAPGMATITATVGTVSTTTQVTVTDATLTSLMVAPAMATLNQGETQRFTATGTFSDGSMQDVSTLVTWTSSNAAVAAVSNAGTSAGVATAVSGGMVTITATSGMVTATATLTVIPVTLESILVSPADATLPRAAEQQYYAVGVYSDGTTRDISGLATWATSDAAVATISNALVSKGLLRTVAAGMANVTATLDGITGTTTLTVTAADLVSITITPANGSMAANTTRQFTAIGTYSDGAMQDITTQVQWTSSNGQVVRITNLVGAEGLARALAPGMVAITATVGTVTASTALTVTGPVDLVSITVTPVNGMLRVGQSLQFSATALYSDGSMGDVTQTVFWSSSRPGVARAQNLPGQRGVVIGTGTGMATITATSQATGLQGQALANVTN